MPGAVGLGGRAPPWADAAAGVHLAPGGAQAARRAGRMLPRFVPAVCRADAGAGSDASDGRRASRRRSATPA